MGSDVPGSACQPEVERGISAGRSVFGVDPLLLVGFPVLVHECEKKSSLSPPARGKSPTIGADRWVGPSGIAHQLTWFSGPAGPRVVVVPPKRGCVRVGPRRRRETCELVDRTHDSFGAFSSAERRCPDGLSVRVWRIHSIGTTNNTVKKSLVMHGPFEIRSSLADKRMTIAAWKEGPWRPPSTIRTT